MRLSVHHVTRYTYSEPVSLVQSRACLTPRFTRQQVVTFHDLRMEPEPTLRHSHEDFFGNQVDYFTVHDSVRSYTITSRFLVEVAPPDGLDVAGSPAHESIVDEVRASQTDEAFEAGQFLFSSPLIPDLEEVDEYAAVSFPSGRPVLEALIDLNSRIHQDFKFDPSATDISTPLQEILRLKRGVCQDFAHLFVACARSRRLPARYVSGYILTQPPPGKPKLIGADASHAWASVWCGDGYGWVDLDPTNNRLVDDEYATLAWGRDYQDVCPLRGVIMGGGQQAITVEVTVLSDEPRAGLGSVARGGVAGLAELSAGPTAGPMGSAARGNLAPVMRNWMTSQPRMSAPITPAEPMPVSGEAARGIEKGVGEIRDEVSDGALERIGDSAVVEAPQEEVEGSSENRID
jgi:transglutaminase-like putative cysteine protease